MKKAILFFLLITSSVLSAQDNYHTELIDFLSEEYNLEDPSFVLFDTEDQIVQNKYTYGNIQASEVSESELGFSNYTTIDVPTAGTQRLDILFLFI